LFSFSSFAKNNSNVVVNSTNTINKTNVSDCNPSTSQIDIDINNVRATLLGGSDMWWDGSNVARYEYPKVDQTSGETPKNVLFLGALWFTGLDDGDNLRCSAQRYRNTGHDFYTGPLQNFGLITSATCDAFDHHFVVYGDEIAEYRNKFESGPVSEADVPLNLLIWPGKGNPYLLNSSSSVYNSWYYNEGSLAPFLDYDGDGIYNPLKGDYPVIKVSEDPITGVLIGSTADQMIFWVINDAGNVHTNSTGTEIGIQVNCLAFAFRTSDELNDMTFYTYEILKKTSGDLKDTYMSIVTDPDIGGAGDDFIGCDTVRSVGYCFNGDMDDSDYGTSSIPFIGIDFFEGPIADDSTELGMSSFMYYNNDATDYGDPDVPQHYRNCEIAKWKNNDFLTYGGNGQDQSNPRTNFAYPANPADVSSGWSECQAGNPVADRRFIQTSGPFTLSTSQSQRISIGVMIAEMTTACPDLEQLMGVADDKAQLLFNNNFSIVDGPDAPTMKIREMDGELIVNLINEEGSNNYGENYFSEVAGTTSNDPLLKNYNFEGYKVYQLKNSTVTSTTKDLKNPDKARLVYQSDIKNGVTKVFDYHEDVVLEQVVPVLQANGNDEGIVKSFKITDDLFATGATKLVNYKTYYYTVVAYAYNNFKQYDPLDTLGVNNCQRQQYLPGRRTTVYSAIPHNVASESNGTIVNSEFGQGVEVNRIEGRGNGGRNIELTEETEAAIVANSFKDILTYKPLFDPLGIKIIDPLKVQDVKFELKIQDDANMVTDSSTWLINVFDANGAQIDTIFSNRPMDRPYDQILEDYGIVVNVGKPLPINTNLSNGKNVYDFISSSISFVDENEKWLSFVQDKGKLEPINWIGSGTVTTDVTTAYLSGVYDSHQYDDIANSAFYDADNVFSSILDGGFAPYCLANNYRRDLSEREGDPNNNGTFEPFSTFAPGFVWDKYSVTNGNEVFNSINTLENMQSINIVMTSDKTKWSKCVVFETGEETAYTVGGARKGQIRQSTSIDENGIDISGEFGRSYFPGYAINVETGERLNIAFGEASNRNDNNGDDMIWNPTSKITDNSTKIDGTDFLIPVYGGKHFIYVFDTRYDGGNAVLAAMSNYDPANNSTINNIPTQVQDVYKSIMYTSIPVLGKGSLELLSLEDGIIPNDVTIKIRVEKPYEKLFTLETVSPTTNDSMPRYNFSTEGLAPTFNDNTTAVDVLDNIRVVPNPYYAFSDYEANQNSNIVKVTNLPDVCKVSIYTMDGKLVKSFERAFGSDANTETGKQDLSLGQELGVSNLNNSLIWNLKNHRDIPVASGTYLIYVDAPGIGQTVVKSVVFVRPPDITNF